MKVLMTGGGTAGHINPAIAIANTIRKNDPGAQIAFVGTEKGMENKLVEKENYPIYHVEVRGFDRDHLLSLENIKAAYLAFVSPIKAKKIIREFRPDVVIGTGGYVSWPILKAAADLGIPTAVHESNATPGLTVKKLQHYVDRVFVNFEQSGKYIADKEKVMCVGNPLRDGFGTIDREEAREKLGIKKDELFVLSCGGSRGAHAINEATLSFMKSFVKKHRGVSCLLSTGEVDYKEMSKKFKESGLEKCPNLRLVEYIHDMPLRMSAADVVICRAGAMTISEVAMAQKACVMIPSPNVVDNHQYKNAKVLSDADAVLMLEEAYMNEETFKEAVVSLLEDGRRRKALSENVKRFANENANTLIYDEIVRLTQKGK